MLFDELCLKRSRFLFRFAFTPISKPLHHPHPSLPELRPEICTTRLTLVGVIELTLNSIKIEAILIENIGKLRAKSVNCNFTA